MSRRLLVVDDEPHMVKTFLDILRLQGWEADGAFSGEEALAAMQAGKYDAVVMDVRMPGMNGVETFAAMKRSQPGIRVILMTAYSALELIEQAKREGAIAVLPKPVNVQELVRRLELEVGGDSRGPILVVDDDPNFLRTLAAVLGAKGFKTIEATGLDDALRRVQEAAPPVVLLDLRLSQGEPRDSVLAIHEMNPLVTIILYSGHPTLLNDTLESLPEPWIHGALHKPFAPEKLIELLEGVLHE